MKLSKRLMLLLNVLTKLKDKIFNGRLVQRSRLKPYQELRKSCSDDVTFFFIGRPLNLPEFLPLPRLCWRNLY